MNPIHLAWLNLIRRPVTSVIAVIAIALSVGASGILLRLNIASENRFATLGAGGDAIVGAKAGNLEILLGALNGEDPAPGFLPYKLFQSLEAQQAVQFEDGATSQPSFIESIIPMLDFGRLRLNPSSGDPKEVAVSPGASPGSFFSGDQDQDLIHVIGTNEKFLRRPREADSLPFQDGHWVEQPNQVVIGAGVAARAHLHLGDHVFARLQAGAAPPVSEAAPREIELVVSGILRPTKTIWDRGAYTSVETAQRALSLLNLGAASIWGTQVLNYFLVYLRPGGRSQLEALVNRRTVAQVVIVEDAKAQLAELTGTGRRLGFFVTALILLLGGLVVAAMLITRFEAMALQLAMLRAIGYKRRDIAAWLLSEGFILGLFAAVLGVALDALGFPVLRGLLGAALPPADLVQVAIWRSAPVWGAALVATMASVFVPLIRVYRQDVHFSLRD